MYAAGNVYIPYSCNEGEPPGSLPYLYAGFALRVFIRAGRATKSLLKEFRGQVLDDLVHD